MSKVGAANPQNLVGIKKKGSFSSSSSNSDEEEKDRRKHNAPMIVGEDVDEDNDDQ